MAQSMVLRGFLGPLGSFASCYQERVSLYQRPLMFCLKQQAPSKTKWLFMSPCKNILLCHYFISPYLSLQICWLGWLFSDSLRELSLLASHSKHKMINLISAQEKDRETNERAWFYLFVYISFAYIKALHSLSEKDKVTDFFHYTLLWACFT